MTRPEANRRRRSPQTAASLWRLEVEIDFDEGEDVNEEDDPEWAEELDPSWPVYVNAMMVPKYNRIVAIQDELAEIVEPLGGIVDGWGTSVE